MDGHQPLAVAPVQPLHLSGLPQQIALQQPLLFLPLHVLAIEGGFDGLAHVPAPVEVALVDLYGVDHAEHFFREHSDLAQRPDGLVVGLVSEEDLGDPEGDVVLVGFQLDVLLQVLEAVLDQGVALLPGLALFPLLLGLAGFPQVD